MADNKYGRGFSFQILRQNIAALQQTNALLADRLCLPVDDSHLHFDTNQILLQYHKSLLPLEVTTPIHLSGSLLSKKQILIFGVGLGEHLNDLLESSAVNPITCWDRDPMLLRLLLMRYDFSDYLRSGRLNIRLGIDILDLLQDIRAYHILKHPTLSQIYITEGILVDDGLKDKRAIVCSGDLMVDDVTEYFLNSGYSVYSINLQQLSRQEIDYTIQKFQPQFIFSINYLDGFAELGDQYRIPTICWEIDPTPDYFPKLEAHSNNAFIFTYKESNVGKYNESGFSHVEYLPLATNINKRKPQPLNNPEMDQYHCEIAFVGSSMVEQAMQHRQQFLKYFTELEPDQGGRLQQAQERLEQILFLQRENYSSYIIPRLLQEYFADFWTQGERQTFPLNPVMLVAEIAASEKRLNYILQLSDYKIKVWGDPGWKLATKFGVQYMGYAGHHWEINKIYSSAIINLDINRLYQMDIVPIRIFDILACEGFLLAEYSPELERLFHIGEELECYKNLDELKMKIQYYLKNPDTARKIAQKGRQAVAQRHTIRHRMARIMSVVAGSSFNLAGNESLESRPGP